LCQVFHGMTNNPLLFAPIYIYAALSRKSVRRILIV
jgi:hypothetical protein